LLQAVEQYVLLVSDSIFFILNDEFANIELKKGTSFWLNVAE